MMTREQLTNMGFTDVPVTVSCRDVLYIHAHPIDDRMAVVVLIRHGVREIVIADEDSQGLSKRYVRRHTERERGVFRFRMWVQKQARMVAMGPEGARA